MRADEWVSRIKSRLGSPIIKLAVSDEMINEAIKESLDKIQPYLKEMEYITGEAPVVDLRKYEPYCVVNVYRTRGTIPVPAVGLMDEFALINYAPYARMGNALAEIMVRNVYRTELTALVPEDWKFIDGFLYLSGFTGPVTIEAITPESTKVMSPKYKSWCFDYSVALVKTMEGEIRSKIQLEGSPITTNGKELKSEGIEEKKALEERLGSDLSLFFAMR